MTETPMPPHEHLPPRFRDVAYDDLPPALQQRVRDEVPDPPPEDPQR